MATVSTLLAGRLAAMKFFAANAESDFDIEAVDYHVEQLGQSVRFWDGGEMRLVADCH